MKILLDASAVMAVVIEEHDRELVVRLTSDSELIAPEMLSCEIGNGLTKLMKRKLLTENEMINAFKYYETIPIEFVKVNYIQALKIAWKNKIYAYDAYYLEVASRLKLPLITLDTGMKNVAKDMKLTVLEDDK